MFITASCPTCMQQANEGGQAPVPIEVPITTEPASQVTCPRGHVSFVAVQDAPYALLYERALQRLSRGLARDAILDAYTAFEMFLVHVVVRARYDREPGASPTQLMSELSDALKTSDRCLAGALVAASIACGGPPPKVPGRLQEMRNRAIHRGEHPSIKEAEEACFTIERLVREFEGCLSKTPRVNAGAYALRWHFEAFKKYRDAMDSADVPFSFASCSCVLDPARAAKPPESAQKRLEAYRSGQRPRAW
jgi:hypothetical protein